MTPGAALALAADAAQAQASTGTAKSAATTKPVVTQAQLEAYVGEYEAGPGRILTITREEGKLHGQPTGQSKQLLTPETDSRFAVGDIPMTITFTRSTDGKIESAIFTRPNGTEIVAKRIVK